jgi:NAD(P)-dependent dehydrogenase (short-subunit alcohol dehydrogenase family)
MEGHVRRTLVSTVYGGTSEIQREIISKSYRPAAVAHSGPRRLYAAAPTLTITGDRYMADKQPFTVRALADSGVVITGGSSGVGLAAAKRFAADGVKRIALLAQHEGRGRSACEAVRAVSPNVQVEFISVDANDPAEATGAAERARELIGGIDVLLNATAATFDPDLIFDIPVEQSPVNLAQQALAPLLMTRIVLPWMREQRGGVIINVASDAAKVPTPGESVIGAAMAAIVLFSRTVALEAKRDGVRVNVLTPSLIQGTRTTERVLSEGYSAKLFKKVGSLAHLGIATPEDQAALISFLAGPEAARLTGQAISLNGGISAA